MFMFLSLAMRPGTGAERYGSPVLVSSRFAAILCRALEDQHLAFSGTKTLDSETPLRYLSPTLRHNMIHLGICMARVVVEEHQTLGMGLLGEVQGVEVGGMPPADAGLLVFL